jgi:hypothetical protein
MTVWGLAAMLLLACGFVLLTASGARAALSWSGPTGQDTGGQGSAIVALACPSAGTCVAVDQAGAASVFDSGNPHAVTPARIDTRPPTGFACLSNTECVAVDGGGNRITFNPASPSSASTVAVDPNHSFTGLSCVSGTSTCVGVDATGYEVLFDPAAPAATRAPFPIGPLKLIAVSCVTDTLCAAIDSANKEITFNPAAPQSAPSPQTLEPGSASLTAVTCPSSTQCLAFDRTGHQIIFNPQAAGTPVTTTIDGPGNGIVAATCASSSQCVALDTAGNAVTFAPGQSQPGALTLIDPHKDLAGIACPSRCVAGDATGHVYGFSPTGGGVTTTLINAQAAYSAVACPATSQCTAMDNFGDEATFDPGSQSAAPAASVDPKADIVYGIACPSVTQCTAVDDVGQAATFNPLSPGAAKVTAIVKGHPLLAVSCPTTDQCTTVDDDRYAATFDPRNPTAAAYVDLGTPAGASLVGVACPSATQCSALDGTGDAVTFNPQAPGRPSPTRVLGGPGVAIACPAVTECIAIDSNGNRATFDPQAPATVATSPVFSTQPASLSCSSPTYCVGLDTAGQALEFDPHGVGATASRSIGDSAQVADLTCPAVTVCVAVDYAGAAFIGSQTIAGPPAALRRPSVAGRLVAGNVVTAKHGAWRGAPTSFSLQWERCRASGRSCLPITGATSQTYRLTNRDIDHAVRVAETAANQLGSSAPAPSRPTRAVAGPPAGPIVSRAQLSDPKGGRPRLILDLAAARYGPLLRTVTVRLPAGLSVAASGPAAAVSLTVRGRKVRGSVRQQSGGFAVALHRWARSLHLALDGPRLIITGTLAARVQRRQVRRLSVTIALSRTLRTVARMSVQAQPGVQVDRRAAAAPSASARDAARRARQGLLRRPDLGARWSLLTAAPLRAQTLTCGSKQPPGSLAAFASATWSDAAGTTFASGTSYGFDSVVQARRAWRQTATKAMRRCLERQLEQGSSQGVSLHATGVRLLPPPTPPAGGPVVSIRRYEVSGTASGAGQDTAVLLDVLLVGNGTWIGEDEFSVTGSSPPTAIERRVAAIQARRITS